MCDPSGTRNFICEIIMKFPVYSLLCQRSEVKGQRAEVRFRPQPTTSPRCGASGHLASDVAAHSLQSASAFTLVELIVVVAIISILLMLLIPNIRTMREKAWSSQCQNNLRQYGIAMNQYMADKSGYFIYPGLGVGWAKDGSTLTGSDIGSWSGFKRGALRGTTVGGAAPDYWWNFVSVYIDANVTLASLSAGEPSIRVCPVVLRELHSANYFDPRSPDFKGYRVTVDSVTLLEMESGDFASDNCNGYDRVTGDLLPDYTTKYLDSYFTTYAINPIKYHQAASNCPANVIAFIDWNAREGWGAWLYNTTAKFLFTSPDNSIVQDVTPKWTNAWWLTEVGFHHRIGNEYGANYVAMDGHVGWISSNTISITNFTGL